MNDIFFIGGTLILFNSPEGNIDTIDNFVGTLIIW
jgi:hypothetical protein